jgi:hypothetical protein
MSITQLPTTTDATADDAMLARLDFSNDALVLNLGAITRFGNPFLADVVASTLLAVAVAEATRGRKANKSQESFEPPPPSLTLEHNNKDETAKPSFFDSLAKRPGALKKFSSFKSSTTVNETPGFDKDIELGEWYGQDKHTKVKVKETKEQKKARKQEEKENRLPFVVRAVGKVVTIAFRTVVWVLKLVIKIVAGVVVAVVRGLGRL